MRKSILTAVLTAVIMLTTTQAAFGATSVANCFTKSSGNVTLQGIVTSKAIRSGNYCELVGNAVSYTYTSDNWYTTKVYHQTFQGTVVFRNENNDPVETWGFGTGASNASSSGKTGINKFFNIYTSNRHKVQTSATFKFKKYSSSSYVSAVTCTDVVHY